MARRTININMEDLIKAFDIGSDDVTRYLNISTGRIAVHTNFGGGFDETGRQIESRNAFDSAEYVEITGTLTYEAYRDMEKFKETVKDKYLRAKLGAVLTKPNPFSSFKQALLENPEENGRWYKFRRECIRQRIYTWLEENNLDLAE